MFFQRSSRIDFRRSRIVPLVAAGWCLTMLSTAPAAAREWARFRGPNGSGASETSTIPARWTEADFNWKVELPGRGHSSPVLWGDKIFVTSADPSTSQWYLLCLNVSDGKTVWKRSFPWANYHIHDQNSFATSTPAVDGQRVYVASATPDQYVLAHRHPRRQGRLACRIRRVYKPARFCLIADRVPGPSHHWQ